MMRMRSNGFIDGGILSGALLFGAVAVVGHWVGDKLSEPPQQPWQVPPAYEQQAPQSNYRQIVNPHNINVYGQPLQNTQRRVK